MFPEFNIHVSGNQEIFTFFFFSGIYRIKKNSSMSVGNRKDIVWFVSAYSEFWITTKYCIKHAKAEKVQSKIYDIFIDLKTTP